MINELQILHYLTEDNYHKIIDKLDRVNADSRKQAHMWHYTHRPIKELQLFDIEYKGFGHIWFMQSVIDFPLFKCSYENFPQVLYHAYTGLFGVECTEALASYDELNVDYIEYADVIHVTNADAVIQKLSEGRCVPEQLDRKRWNEFKKSHGTIEFCIAKEDSSHLAILARAHGTAMKKRIKDEKYHRATGITPRIAVNSETEKDILSWCMRMQRLNEMGAVFI
jgi:hypothetical protein